MLVAIIWKRAFSDGTDGAPSRNHPDTHVGPELVSRVQWMLCLLQDPQVGSRWG